MYCKSVLTFFITVFFSFQCLSQTSKFDSIFLHTTQDLLSSAPKKALSNTNYLYKISKNNTERIKTCMLRATLLRQYDLNDDAIIALLKADSLAKIDKNYFMLARANGFLSTIYRETGIHSVGKTFLSKAENASRKIKDKNDKYRFQGNFCQELAYYEMEDRNYSKAIKQLFKGKKIFKKIDSDFDEHFHNAVNDEMIAKNYFSLQKIDSALFFYNEAKHQLSISKSPKSPLKGFIYRGLGNVYTSINDYKNAEISYLKAEEIAEASNFYNLRNDVYQSLLQFYRKINNNKKYIHYNELYLNLIQTEEKDRKAIADNLITALHNNEKSMQYSYQQRFISITSICIIIIVITLGIYFYKRRKDRKKFKDFIRKQDQLVTHNPLTTTLKTPEVSDTPKKEVSKEYMSTEAEESIYNRITEFESSQFYLNKDVSLNVMAAELGINHRYLSHVIKKYKQKDFASYISELRINYIVKCLNSDPEFLKYKISYLAEKCGFSSHSRFTITFKKETGVSPLHYINYLKENPPNV